MMNKKNWIILASIILILAIVYFSVNKKNTSVQTTNSPSQVEITNQSPTVAKDKLHKILSADSIAKWGFAATNNGICYIGTDLSFKFFDLDTKQTQMILKPQASFDSVKIVSTSTSCLVEYFASDKNSIYLYQGGSEATPLTQSPTTQISASSDLYTFGTEDSQIILNSDGTIANTISDPDQANFVIAPVNSKKYFVVGPYDQEDYTGKMRLVDNGSEKFSIDVSSALGLFANNSSTLLLTQNGKQIDTKLISNTGTTIASVSSLDPDSIVASSSGFYFLTQPGGIGSNRAELNAVGFISNSGETKNLISSLDDPENQYNFSALSIRGNILYVSNQDSVYKVQI